VAFIDAEMGVAPYRQQHPDMLVWPEKRYARILQVVHALAEDPDRFATLVIDSLSVPYQLMLSTKAKGDYISSTARAVVNRRMDDLYNALDRLTCNIVVTARHKVAWKQGSSGRDGDLEYAGETPDVDSAVDYLFDVVVHLDQPLRGVITKKRGAASGQRFPVNATAYRDHIHAIAAELGLLRGALPGAAVPPTAAPAPEAESPSESPEADRGTDTAPASNGTPSRNGHGVNWGSRGALVMALKGKLNWNGHGVIHKLEQLHADGAIEADWDDSAIVEVVLASARASKAGSGTDAGAEPFDELGYGYWMQHETELVILVAEELGDTSDPGLLAAAQFLRDLELKERIFRDHDPEERQDVALMEAGARKAGVPEPEV
jgi:hypothetical protein